MGKETGMKRERRFFSINFGSRNEFTLSQIHFSPNLLSSLKGKHGGYLSQAEVHSFDDFGNAVDVRSRRMGLIGKEFVQRTCADECFLLPTR
ncbi:hypothetical protein NPIL_297021 [Nephila pilipes]|uniref:Uncharacterized protein n=1 Tax=Nephila pilipes TaxID=299642 RepID=A0A8X6PT34_NEPPI|nr:hypothetical protein NPIL_297021 [Nephila pilipes]